MTVLASIWTEATTLGPLTLGTFVTAAVMWWGATLPRDGSDDETNLPSGGCPLETA